MGIAGNPEPVKLFMAIMHTGGIDLQALLNRLTNRYGDIECSYGPVAFTFTGYYDAEMGTGLHKGYYVFQPLIPRELLPEIKNAANSLEAEYAVNGKRIINLDPGYIARDKLTLASTKDFYHRLYLGQGIFGEVTLHYRKGGFRFFSWTYPDYKQPEVQAILEKGRASLVGALRKTREGIKDLIKE
jgi:hypothetical protein